MPVVQGTTKQCTFYFGLGAQCFIIEGLLWLKKSRDSNILESISPRLRIRVIKGLLSAEELLKFLCYARRQNF